MHTLCKQPYTALWHTLCKAVLHNARTHVPSWHVCGILLGKQYSTTFQQADSQCHATGDFTYCTSFQKYYTTFQLTLCK
jgi:hypothetical protein